MSSCCNTPKPESSCHDEKSSVDYVLWVSLICTVIFYLLHWQFSYLIEGITWAVVIAESVFSLMNIIWWGIALGIIMLALLSKVPREFVFMDRAALGLGSVFLHLQSEVNWYQTFNELIDGFDVKTLEKRQAKTLKKFGLEV